MRPLLRALILSFWIAGEALASVVKPGAPEIEIHWTVPTRRPKQPVEGFLQEHTRPVVLGEIIYIGSRSGRVAAVHRKLGYKLWETNIGAPIEGSLAYGRSLVVAGDTQGRLHALNARDGSVSWTFTAKSEWLSPAAVLPERVIAVTSGGDIYGLSESRGAEVWHQVRRGDEKMTVRGASGPASFGNEVYVGFSDGSALALAADTGKIRWEKILRTRDRFYDIKMIPSVDSDSVILGTFDGKTYKLNRLTGETQWSFGVGSYGGYLVDGDRVYFSGLDGKFYALNRANGEKIWERPFPESGVGTAPAKIGDYLAVTTSGDPMFLLDAKTGEVANKFAVGAGTLSPVVTDPDSGFYCLSGFGNFYSFFLRPTRSINKGLGKVPVLSALRK